MIFIQFIFACSISAVVTKRPRLVWYLFRNRLMNTWHFAVMCKSLLSEEYRSMSVQIPIFWEWHTTEVPDSSSIWLISSDSEFMATEGQSSDDCDNHDGPCHHSEWFTSWKDEIPREAQSAGFFFLEQVTKMPLRSTLVLKLLDYARIPSIVTDVS